MTLETLRNMKALMIPLSVLYGVVMWLRNVLFDLGMLRQRAFDLTVVSVGNLTVGGTGKTPMVEYLLEKVGRQRRVAMLSRGYGRKTTGFVMASEGVSAREIGDEPMQIGMKFPWVTVAVDADRRHGIERLCQVVEGLDLVILDDAYQHRYVKPTWSILLMDYGRKIYDDHLLPWGDLRESAGGVERAHAIVVTKCPKVVSAEERREVRHRLRLRDDQALFFAAIENGEAQAVFDEAREGDGVSVVLVTGIGNPKPLEDELRGRYGDTLRVMRYGDHHDFTTEDLEDMTRAAQSARLMLTTEKDACRLRGGIMGVENKRWAALRERLYYVPMRTTFLDTDGELFDAWLTDHGVSEENEKKQ